MLCCGLFALLAAAALGVWRLVRAHRRMFLTLATALLVAGPVAALAMGRVTDTGRSDVWSVAMRSLCGAASQPFQPKSGDHR